MKFSDLKFKPHPYLRGASKATESFGNQWEISVLTGNRSLSISAQGPYEVTITQRDGEYLSGDVLFEQTEEDINEILEVITRDEVVKKDVEGKLPFFTEWDDIWAGEIKAWGFSSTKWIFEYTGCDIPWHALQQREGNS